MAFSARTESSVISNINVTPLVDVLLVLLIIFMITAPVISHRTRIDLPHSSNMAPPRHPHEATLAIGTAGDLYWNGTPVSETQLDAQLAILARTDANASLIVETSDRASYESFARAMVAAKRQGLTRFSFAGAF